MSKTLKIIAWVKNTSEICPREGHTKCTMRIPAVVWHGTRSLTYMQALQYFRSGCTVHSDLGHGSGMAGVHSMHICEPHGAPNGLNSAYEYSNS